jgi:hypothetical protein
VVDDEAERKNVAVLKAAVRTVEDRCDENC